MIDQLLGNWLCWAIVLLALVCYQQLWVNYLGLRAETDQLDNPQDHQHDAVMQCDFSNILIGALPLLGLLGTIMGLLDCFAGIANEGASGKLVSGGITDALLTTQLGLVCAIPGWLLQAFVRSKTGQSKVRCTNSHLVSHYAPGRS